MSMRTQRVESLIKNEISNILLHEIADPRIGFTTINRVEVSKDIKFAKVYYSVLGNEEEQRKTKEGLKSAGGFIQKIIGERLKLKFTPHITFLLDDAARKTIELNNLLNDLKRKEDT